jgi:hypothetical protein
VGHDGNREQLAGRLGAIISREKDQEKFKDRERTVESNYIGPKPRRLNRESLN